MTAGIAGAAGSALPEGWWKGTIVVEERWDQFATGTANEQFEQGSATLRIQITERKRASYEFDYRQETRWVSGACPGKLTQVKTASFKSAGPIEIDGTT